MELEPRTTAPAHATGAVEFVDLSAIDGDGTFRLREEGDVSALATSLGRLGQLVPLELRPLPEAAGPSPRYQLVAGFRRVAALRLLRRERALARVHTALSEEDAWALALSLALLTEPVDEESLGTLRERLEAEHLAPWAGPLLDEALLRAQTLSQIEGDSPGEAPPAMDDDGTVEVTPEELAADLAARLYEVNQDLAVAYEVWSDLPGEGRRAILEQARWLAALLPGLERDGEER